MDAEMSKRVLDEFLKKTEDGFIVVDKEGIIREINEKSEIIRQDNEDLENLQTLYEKLPLTEYNRMIIDDLLFCIQSRQERMEQYLYYAGLFDGVNF